MSTIKTERKILEQLLNGVTNTEQFLNNDNKSNNTSPTSNIPDKIISVNSVIDNTADTDISVTKVFEYDYENQKKIIKKKARRTLNNIVKHVLSEDMLQNEYVKDKIEQDIDTLTDLYMQSETNNVMQKSIIDTVAHGNIMPRYYEVFANLSDKIQAINKQIITTETAIRKTYIDIKFEIHNKEADEAEAKMFNQNALPEQKQIPIKQNNDIIFSSSKDLIELAKNKHKANLKQKIENNIEEGNIINNDYSEYLEEK